MDLMSEFKILAIVIGSGFLFSMIGIFISNRAKNKELEERLAEDTSSTPKPEYAIHYTRKSYPEYNQSESYVPVYASSQHRITNSNMTDSNNITIVNTPINYRAEYPQYPAPTAIKRNRFQVVNSGSSERSFR